MRVVSDMKTVTTHTTTVSETAFSDESNASGREWELDEGGNVLGMA